MADREKVIYDLERCTCHVPDACRDCSKYNADGVSTLTCMESLMSDALELLKEQEPVEPQKENDGNPGKWASWWYVCGNCGGAIDYRDRFCRYCGKAVKWDD